MNEITIVETYLKKIKKARIETEKIASPQCGARLFSKLFGDNAQECFSVICLDVKGVPTHMSIVHKGTTSEINISVKDIMKVAILSNASSIIIGHNHPSGDLTPSTNDIAVTSALSQACKLMNLELLDHIIITSESYTSFVNEGEL